MKSFLKILGLILVVIGAIVLVVSFVTGNVNYNTPLVVGMLFILVGIIAYVILNKYIAD